MKFFIVLLGFLFISISDAFVTPAKMQNQGKRLIQTSETDPGTWLTETEILETLVQNRINFMDITDHQFVAIDRKIVRGNRDQYPSELKYQSNVTNILPLIDIPRMENFIQKFSSFNNRFYISDTGVESTVWLMSQINEAYTTSNYQGSKVTIETYDHLWFQKSIIARIQGTDPNFRVANEIIIFGSHLDSIRKFNPIFGRSPGADDNGSGSVVLLETFRVLLNSGFVPKRSIEFHWYAAEEVGLRGSQDIAKSYQSQKKNVIGMMNFDVVGYTKSANNLNISVLTDFTDANLNNFVRLNIDNYCDVSKWKNSKCGYACTDHASWTKYGFPAVSPVESDFNPYMHSARDTIDHVNFLYVSQFVRLATGFSIELAEPLSFRN